MSEEIKLKQEDILKRKKFQIVIDIVKAYFNDEFRPEIEKAISEMPFFNQIPLLCKITTSETETTTNPYIHFKIYNQESCADNSFFIFYNLQRGIYLTDKYTNIIDGYCTLDDILEYIKKETFEFIGVKYG